MCSSFFPSHGELPPEGVIDIWLVPLTSTAEESLELDRVLSIDERRRATHFRLDRDATRFRERRARLRMALSGYLDQPASELVITTGAFGKPRLAGESPLRFNLGHSESLALMAFTTGCEIGIDVEAITGNGNWRREYRSVFYSGRECLSSATRFNRCANAYFPPAVDTKGSGPQSGGLRTIFASGFGRRRQRQYRVRAHSARFTLAGGPG